MTDSISVSGSAYSHNNTAPQSGTKKWPVQFPLPKFNKEVFECLEIMKDKTAYQVLSPRLRKKIVNSIFGKMSAYTM